MVSARLRDRRGPRGRAPRGTDRGRSPVYARLSAVLGLALLYGAVRPAGATAQAGEADASAVAADAERDAGALDSGREAAADAAVGADAAPELVPPRVLESVPPIYPVAHLEHGEHPTVVLKVTIQPDGSVADVTVEHSSGDDFDRAAIEAVTRWKFAPARRGPQAIASRVGVAVHFELPELGVVDVASVSEAAGVVPHPHEEPPPDRPAPEAPGEPAYGAEAQVSEELRAGASDFHITLGALRLVPRANATDYLKLAPGILLTNEGGDGHAEQIFMRGFDAREGQDVELTVDGVPINDSGNLHGNGYADTHFIIPELIASLRVVEGPFSPAQGNYAVAGSADYQLGVETRGTMTKLTYGSWNTERALLVWAPPGESAGTFGAVEARRTDGFGVNRASRRATAMGQYQAKLGEGASLRVGAQAYATHYQSAGVVRQDDWESGRVGFFGTEDPLQGGDASRFSLYGAYEKKRELLNLQQSLFFIRRDMRLREDFTGFLLDTQDALDTLHGQRGDLIDTSFGAFVLGGRGLGSWSTLFRGLKQSLDVGYFARLDLTDSTQYRNTVPGDVPYRLMTDLRSTLTDIALFADAAVRPIRFVTLRGGVRADTFTYNVLNGCAAQGDFDNPSRSRPPTNESCHDQLPFGAHREPVQRASTGAIKILPRATLIVGPFEELNLTASYGQGVRSIDPIYIAQDLDTPSARVRA